MAIDFNARPAGMSKREYAASILGGSKDSYSSSGQPISAGSSSSKTKASSVSAPKVKEVKYTDLVDTKPIEKAYGAAKETYLGSLTALKPRYEALYAQLEAEKGLAVEKETALSETEQTQQKVNIAKRGISTDTDNPFFTTEAGKLSKEQNTRLRETVLQFAGKRLDISGAESADTRDITTAIANLDLGKATTIGGMIATAKQSAASLNSAAAERAIQQSQWERTFEYTKSKDAADRALEMYKLAKSETKSGNDAYNTALSTLVASAYNPKDGKIAPYTRENIAKQLEAEFPKLSGQIKGDIEKFFPNGWEQGAGTIVDNKAQDTASKALALVDTLENSPGLKTAVGVKGMTGGFLGGWTVPGTDAADFVTRFDSLKSLLTLENMGLMKGVLSDSDMKVIQQASASLNRSMTESEFKKELTKIKGILQSKLGGSGGNDPLGLGI